MSCPVSEESSANEESHGHCGVGQGSYQHLFWARKSRVDFQEAESQKQLMGGGGESRGIGKRGYGTMTEVKRKCNNLSHDRTNFNILPQLEVSYTHCFESFSSQPWVPVAHRQHASLFICQFDCIFGTHLCSPHQSRCGRGRSFRCGWCLQMVDSKQVTLLRADRPTPISWISLWTKPRFLDTKRICLKAAAEKPCLSSSLLDALCTWGLKW